MTTATTRIVKGAIENVSAIGALTIVAAGAAVKHCVRQQACDADVTSTQHPPTGSVSAISAITSTPIRHLTPRSSSDRVPVAMRTIKPSCDDDHLPK